MYSEIGTVGRVEKQHGVSADTRSRYRVDSRVAHGADGLSGPGSWRTKDVSILKSFTNSP
jgi:hypothetical protein